MTEAVPVLPPNLLMEFILSLLAQLLMTGSSADMHFARLAAAETIAAYNARGQDELVTIGQIVGFALTALDNLRLSLPTDLSVSMKLKFRSNASVLSRAAQGNTQALEKTRRANPPLEPSLAEQATVAAWNQPEADPMPATEVADIGPTAQTVATAPVGPVAVEQQNRLLWANTMKTEAARLQASAAHVTSAQRTSDKLWIDVLNDVASGLTFGKPPIARAGTSRAELLRTTLMAAAPGFPSHLVTSPPRSVPATPK